MRTTSGGRLAGRVLRRSRENSMAAAIRRAENARPSSAKKEEKTRDGRR